MMPLTARIPDPLQHSLEPQATKPLILIVDDDWMNREVLRGHIEFADFRVIEAASGEKALALVTAQQPDLVVLDALLPGQSGFEVCQHMKANPATAKIPVIILTALGEAKDQQAALDAGADGFLLKSVPSQVLLDQIATLIGARSATRSA